MQSKVPLPTDNIYKFYALFGLFLLLASIYLYVNLHQSYNERFYNWYVELEAFSDIEELTNTQSAKKLVVEKQVEIAKSDRRFYRTVLSVITGAAIYLMVYGFFCWHYKIQPLQDELLKKQLEKIELEIKSLNKNAQRVHFPRPKS